MSEHVYQKCISTSCGASYSVDETLIACPRCGSLLDVEYDWSRLPVPGKLSYFERYWGERHIPQRFSGVWRFQELLPFTELGKCLTVGEGQTILQQSPGVSHYVGVHKDRLYLQYEGLNPSGSFKDNGMVAAITHANLTGASTAACASTGNTSASLAMYCACTHNMKAIIFIGSGKIAYGKLSQALDYGALTLQISGDFDDAMARVKEVSRELGIYLVNSVNPFRLEGQKTIMLRVLEALHWNIPDWIVVPGGNLGNSSSFGKAFHELKELGLITRIPRLAIINASGANTLSRLVNEEGITWNDGGVNRDKINAYYKEMDAQGRRADTLASAIEINRPVNLEKCLRAIQWCDGVVREVSDQEILDAKSQVGASGFGCEPASAASVAGAKKLREEGVIMPEERVVCILTGHQLKDPTATVAYHSGDAQKFQETLGIRGIHETPYANHPLSVPNDVDSIVSALHNRINR